MTRRVLKNILDVVSLEVKSYAFCSRDGECALIGLRHSRTSREGPAAKAKSS